MCAITVIHRLLLSLENSNCFSVLPYRAVVSTDGVCLGSR